MCGVSGVELIVILVVAIIVIGPEKLPEVMGSLGKFTRDIKKATSELTNVRDDVTRSLKETADDARRTTRARTRNALVDDEELSELDAIRARRKEKKKELDVDIDKLPAQLRPAARALSTTMATGSAIASMGEKSSRRASQQPTDAPEGQQAEAGAPAAREATDPSLPDAEEPAAPLPEKPASLSAVSEAEAPQTDDAPLPEKPASLSAVSEADAPDTDDESDQRGDA